MKENSMNKINKKDRGILISMSNLKSELWWMWFVTYKSKAC